MERYRVVRIEEQMYGCETLSCPDAELTRQGIDEGDTVLWDGTALRKA